MWKYLTKWNGNTWNDFGCNCKLHPSATHQPTRRQPQTATVFLFSVSLSLSLWILIRHQKATRQNTLQYVVPMRYLYGGDHHPPAHAWYDAGALGKAALIAVLKLSHNHQRNRGQRGSGDDARHRSRGLVRSRAGVLTSLASGLLIGLAVRWVGAVRGSADVAEAYRQSDTANEQIQINTQTPCHHELHVSTRSKEGRTCARKAPSTSHRRTV